MDTPRVTGHREALAVPAGDGGLWFCRGTSAEIVRTGGGNVGSSAPIYALRVGEILELFATQGLNPDSACDTTAVGEGLVGTTY